MSSPPRKAVLAGGLRYKISQRNRKLVEEAFGWVKIIAGMAKVKVRRLARVRFKFTFAMAAYNLTRMPRLLAAA
jgi:hypothetical protein